MHNNRDNDKAKDFKKSIVNLIKYLKPFIFLIVISIILSFISSILSIIGPDKLRDMTNTITEGITTFINMDAIKSIALFLVIIYGVSALLGYVQGFIMASVTQKITKKLRRQISEKINRLPLKYFDKASFGDVLSRVTNDVDTIGMTMNQSVSILVSSITLLIGSTVMMFYTNYILAISAIVSSLIGFGLMIVILSKSQKYFTGQQRELGKLNGHIEEIYSNQSVVRVYNASLDAKDKFNEINNDLFDNSRKSQFLSSLMMPIMSFIGNFGYVVVCTVGAVLVLNGNTEFGSIVAFMIYIRLFTNPLTQIAQASSSVQSAAAASERVFEFLDEEELVSEEDLKKRLKKSDVKGNVDFENVKFGYNDDALVIKGFSASVKAGDKIAIVGPTGAGKTTMVNLLMKFYDITDGDIKIDGVSIKELTRERECT